MAARANMRYLPAVHPEEETRAWIRDVVLPDLEVWVAEESGRVVAFVALRDEWLEHLYVEPAAQARGIGTGLVDLAKQRRPAGLQLWVFQRNKGARRLYERLGFGLERLTEGDHNEEREPDALYRWRGNQPAGDSPPRR